MFNFGERVEKIGVEFTYVFPLCPSFFNFLLILFGGATMMKRWRNNRQGNSGRSCRSRRASPCERKGRSSNEVRSRRFSRSIERRWAVLGSLRRGRSGNNDRRSRPGIFTHIVNFRRYRRSNKGSTSNLRVKCWIRRPSRRTRTGHRKRIGSSRPNTRRSSSRGYSRDLATRMKIRSVLCIFNGTQCGNAITFKGWLGPTLQRFLVIRRSRRRMRRRRRGTRRNSSRIRYLQRRIPRLISNRRSDSRCIISLWRARSIILIRILLRRRFSILYGNQVPYFSSGFKGRQSRLRRLESSKESSCTRRTHGTNRCRCRKSSGTRSTITRPRFVLRRGRCEVCRMNGRPNSRR